MAFYTLLIIVVVTAKWIQGAHDVETTTFEITGALIESTTTRWPEFRYKGGRRQEEGETPAAPPEPEPQPEPQPKRSTEDQPNIINEDEENSGNNLFIGNLICTFLKHTHTRHARLFL